MEIVTFTGNISSSELMFPIYNFARFFIIHHSFDTAKIYTPLSSAFVRVVILTLPDQDILQSIPHSGQDYHIWFLKKTKIYYLVINLLHTHENN